MKAVLFIFVSFTILSVVLGKLKTYNDALDFWNTNYSLNEHRGHCIHISEVDPDLVSRMYGNGEYPDDEKLACFSRCLLIHLDLVKDDNVIKTDNLKKYLTLDTEEGITVDADAIIEKCSEIKIEDGCQSGGEFGKCICFSVRDAFGV